MLLLLFFTSLINGLECERFSDFLFSVISFCFIHEGTLMTCVELVFIWHQRIGVCGRPHLFFFLPASLSFWIFYPGDHVSLSVLCWSLSSRHCFTLSCSHSCSFWNARDPVMSCLLPCRPLSVFQAEDRCCPSGFWSPPGLADVCCSEPSCLSAAPAPCEASAGGVQTGSPGWCIHLQRSRKHYLLH